MLGAERVGDVLLPQPRPIPAHGGPEDVCSLVAVHDLAVVIVSYGSARWLPACLDSLRAHQGGASMEVIVTDNGPGPEAAELIRSDYPWVRLVPSENRGFAHGNNVGMEQADARWLLFLNPDMEVAGGSFDDLLGWADKQPKLGIAGALQYDFHGPLEPTMRRFPSPATAWGEALGLQRFVPALGERVLGNESFYRQEHSCDWVSGSFMLCRREALAAAGAFDDRFFLFSEEVDLALRVRLAGWEVRHTPRMTVLHAITQRSLDERIAAQGGLSRRLYADKHMRGMRRRAYLTAAWTGYALRSLLPDRDRRRAARRARRALTRRDPPPFG